MKKVMMKEMKRRKKKVETEALKESTLLSSAIVTLCSLVWHTGCKVSG